MSEPENHTLRVLREFREEFRTFSTKTETNFAEIKEHIDNLARMVAGESVIGRYAAAGFEERLAAVEKRLSTLESRN